MTTLIGQTISHFQITAKLGEGGMGVVYEAKDLTLNRTVALKFLPHGSEAHEPERARFLQEARAAAALNHPNICTIYEIAEVEGQQFIVMEYVHGKTLREMLAIQRLSDAIGYAVQIGEALQEAHAQGIVHRDIKAENIMVNSKNQVKVMDFGLAKLKGSLRLTKTSSTIGTLAYMSPEQVQGQEVDARSDIFSFGIVLYEMLTGHLPFRGEHEAAMVYSIVNEEPVPLAKHIPDAPSGLIHVLDRAFEKDPEERYQSMHDVVIELRRLKKETSKTVRRPPVAGPVPVADAEPGMPPPVGTAPKAKGAIRNRIIVVSAAVLIVALSLVVYYLLSRGQRGAPAMTRTQLTFAGNVRLAEISPDGKSFACADDSGCVYVQDIDGGKPLKVFKSPWILNMRWAPGGTELAVVGKVDTSWLTFIVPRFGGTYRGLRFVGVAISWSPEGSSIFGLIDTKRVEFLKTSGGEDTTRFSLKHGFHWTGDADWSPVGDVIAVQSMDSLEHDYGIMTTSKDGSRQSVVVEDSVPILSPRWASRGSAIYYLRGQPPNQDLMKIGVNPENGERKGVPRPIQSGLDIYRFSITRDNKRLVYRGGQASTNLWSATYSEVGSEKIVNEKQITEGTSRVAYVSISPDGRRIAYSKSGTSGTDLFVSPIEGGEERQLTFGDKIIVMAWSPDGKEIAYTSSRGGTRVVRLIGVDGSGARVVGKNQPSDELTWAPGRFILYQLPGDRNFQILDPKTGEERPLVRNDSVGYMFSPRYSPDGKQIVLHWNRYHNPGLWLLSIEDTTQYFLYNTHMPPFCWSADGRSVFVWDERDRHTVVTISIASGKAEKFITLRNEGVPRDLDPTAKKIVWVVAQRNGDAWMIENFDPEVE